MCVCVCVCYLLAPFEMQAATSRIWTQVSISIFNDDMFYIYTEVPVV